MISLGSIFDIFAGLPSGLPVGLTAGCALGLSIGFATNLFVGRDLGLLKGLYVGLGFGLVVGLLIGIADDPVFGLAIGLSVSLAYGFGFLRIDCLILHYFLLWPRVQVHWYHLHPIAWEDVSVLPLIGLERLLVAYAEYEPKIGKREIDRLIDEYPSQRMAALLAQAILVVRRAAMLTNLVLLDEVLARLPAGEIGFLKETSALRSRAQAITIAQARIDTLSRPFLREPFAALLVKEIESFEQQIAGFRPPLSTELRRAARRWLEVARDQFHAVRASSSREPQRQVFRAGDPVDREREAFVPRTSLLSELEQQILLATGCPGLLVYGRRRMGKSTLLRNLSGFLPPGVQVVQISMQRASAFSSLSDLLNRIAQEVCQLDAKFPPSLYVKNPPLWLSQLT